MIEFYAIADKNAIYRLNFPPSLIDSDTKTTTWLQRGNEKKSEGRWNYRFMWKSEHRKNWRSRKRIIDLSCASAWQLSYSPKIAMACAKKNPCQRNDRFASKKKWFQIHFLRIFFIHGTWCITLFQHFIISSRYLFTIDSINQQILWEPILATNAIIINFCKQSICIAIPETSFNLIVYRWKCAANSRGLWIFPDE